MSRWLIILNDGWSVIIILNSPVWFELFSFFFFPVYCRIGKILFYKNSVRPSAIKTKLDLRLGLLKHKRIGILGFQLPQLYEKLIYLVYIISWNSWNSWISTMLLELFIRFFKLIKTKWFHSPVDWQVKKLTADKETLGKSNIGQMGEISVD